MKMEKSKKYSTQQLFSHQHQEKMGREDEFGRDERNSHRFRSRSPHDNRRRNRSRERSYERERSRSFEREKKRYRSRSPPSLSSKQQSRYNSSRFEETQKRYKTMERRSKSPEKFAGRNGGDRDRDRDGGRGGGRGGRGRGRGGGGGRGKHGESDDNQNFVDLRVDGVKKKSNAVKFVDDDGLLGEPGEMNIMRKNMNEDGKGEVITEENLQEIEEFLLNEEETEEERERRLIEERRKRREEILKKHQTREVEPISTVMEVKENDPTPPSIEGVKDDDEDDKASTKTFPLSNRDVDVETAAAALMAEREAVAAEEKREATISYDIFSTSPSTNTIPMKKGETFGKRVMKDALLEGEDPLLQSNWDDGEGYYKTRIGEVICDRYRTMGEVGKGVFSTVLKCLDLRSYESEDSDTHPQVVLKVIRNNDIMRKASEKELQILSLISRADPDGKKHCVRMISTSDYRNHIVIVFEPLSMNLRETLKRFGKNVGINVTAVRMYARQLFVALRHLSDLKIVHADIKPDNIVVSEDLKTIKLCDFGSAFLETDAGNDPTPYLVSRFYRAPEIILALPYDRNIDLWSVGVCLYELFTGHVMFPGRTNNEMLKLMMEVKGKVPNKLIKASQRQYESMSLDPHFDSDMKFKLIESDPVTGKPVMRLVEIIAPTKDLSTILLSSKAGADDRSLVAKLTDLLDKCLILDPAKRIKVMDALKHPLFQSTQHSHSHSHSHSNSHHGASNGSHTSARSSKG